MSLIGIKSLYNLHKLALIAQSELLKEKSNLTTEMHIEMLSITRTQYEILHSSSHDEVRQSLSSLSNQVSNYLMNYHQLKDLADSSDIEILAQFNRSFNQWHDYNKTLLNYANVVSDVGFIDTLKRIDMAFSQFEMDSSDAILLIAELKRGAVNDNELSN